MTEQEHWSGDKMTDYDGRRPGGHGWRIKVDPMTMTALVCAAGLPGSLPGALDMSAAQIEIDGERWTSDRMAFFALMLADRGLDIPGLDEDISNARILAMGSLQERCKKIAELFESARKSHEDAVKGHEERRRKLGGPDRRPH